MLLAAVMVVAGFVLLIKGADFFVDGSSSVAKMLRIPSIIIGLTIVAMGTSLPECAVSVTASLAGNNSLAVSNAVGSNIFNLIVVCGACALFTPLTVQKETLKKEFPFSIVCAILLVVAGYLGMSLGRADGIIFLLIFTGYLLLMIKNAMKTRKEVSGDAQEGLNTKSNMQDSESEKDTKKEKLLPVWKCILFILGGAVAIKFGGDFVVDGASVIAAGFGLSQTLIGLTVVALGTSLPELVTSIVAAKKNEVDMAIGNVVGSNIFNILLVLGIAASISPIAFLTENLIDIAILIVMSIVVWIFAFTNSSLRRGEGIIMLLGYVAYMVYIIIR